MSLTGPCGEVLGSLEKLKGGPWVGTANEAGHILEEFSLARNMSV